MKASPVKRKSLDEVKLDFLLSVYEAITKQIQQMDFKISILLSWNGLIAVMISRELGFVLTQKSHQVFPIITLTLSVVGLIIGAFYTYRVLKPRVGKMDNTFAGLLFANDILCLGKNNSERLSNYLGLLTKIETHEELHQQFVKSIVLISEICVQKNRLFNRALLGTSSSFLLLLMPICLRSLRMQ